MTPTLPAHAPSFSVPALRRPRAVPCSSPSHRGPSSTAGRAHLGSRRSQTVGPACQSAAGRHRQPPSRTRAGGRGRDQHRDQILLVGPTEPAQLAAGMEARGGRACSRAARAGAGCAPRRGPGAHGVPAGHGERAARGPYPRRGRRGRAARGTRQGDGVHRRAAARRPRSAAGRGRADGQRVGAGTRPARHATADLGPTSRTALQEAEGGFAQLPVLRSDVGGSAQVDVQHRSSGATPASSPARTCSPARCSSSWAPLRSPGSRTR